MNNPFDLLNYYVAVGLDALAELADTFVDSIDSLYDINGGETLPQVEETVPAQGEPASVSTSE